MSRQRQRLSTGGQGPNVLADDNTAAKPIVSEAQRKQLHQEVKNAILLDREEEIRISEMECRLREMILEVLKPTLRRTTNIQADYHDLCAQFKKLEERADIIAQEIDKVKAITDLMPEIQNRIAQCTKRENDIEEQLSQHRLSTRLRLEKLETQAEDSENNCAKLARNFDRCMEDLDGLASQGNQLQKNIEEGLAKNKDMFLEELRRLELVQRQLQTQLVTFTEQVMGAEDCHIEHSPPSVRRLDLQMKRAQGLLQEAVHDIEQLRRLDDGLIKVEGRQTAMEGELKNATESYVALRARLENSSKEVRDELRTVTNKMAAFNANLVRELRNSSQTDTMQVKQIRQDIEAFVKETQRAIDSLKSEVAKGTRYMEASLREVHTDMDASELKRAQDKQGLENSVMGLRDRIVALLDSSEAAVKGLEHISNVVGLSLQTCRMSVALDLQDFAERKDTPYVGFREDERGRGRRPGGRGLDPDYLMPLTYYPQPISYEGAAFERPQLLALREKLVVVAQEVLQRGPGAGTSKPSSPSGTRGRRTNSALGTATPGDLKVIHQAMPDGEASGPSRSATPLQARRPSSRQGSSRIRQSSSRQSSARGTPAFEGLDQEEHELTMVVTPELSSSRGAASDFSRGAKVDAHIPANKHLPALSIRTDAAGGVGMPGMASISPSPPPLSTR